MSETEPKGSMYKALQQAFVLAYGIRVVITSRNPCIVSELVALLCLAAHTHPNLRELVKS